MEENPKTCRLCLKVIEKDAIYFPLTNNNAVLRNLNLISFVTIKNLSFTEHPVICDLCDNKLIELANFKENIIYNELQIQRNQQNDVNPFLEDISKDIIKVCRLCLKISEDTAELRKKWDDSTEIFVTCGIHMNLNIPEPSTICNLCDTTLQSLYCFVSDCAKNEQLIANKASENKNLSLEDMIKLNCGENEQLIVDDKKNLSLEDMIQVETIEIEIPKNVKGEEDNNNISQQSESLKEESSSKNITETITEREETIQENINTPPEEENISNSKQLHGNTSDSDCLDLENLSFNRTPNTYTRTKPKIFQNQVVTASTSKLNILSDICLRKQDEPSTSKLAASKTNIDKIQSKFLTHTSIDVFPVSNLADITFDMSLGRVLEVDSSEDEKNNVTKELIDLLEGTEELVLTNGDEIKSVCTSKQYRHTEELLRILEDDSEVNVLEVDKHIKDTGKCESNESPKAKIEKGFVEISPVIKTVSYIKSPTIPETGEIAGESNNRASPVRTQKAKNVKGKRTSTSVIKKSVPVKGNSTEKGKNKIIAKPSTVAGTKGHNLRQKTIVTSFRDMLNMKPLKQKSSESTKDFKEVPNSKKTVGKLEIQAKGSSKKQLVRRIVKIPKEKEDSHNQILSSEDQTSEELQTISEIQDVSFDKIQIQEISLVDDESISDKPQIPLQIGIKKGNIRTVPKSNIKSHGKETSNNVEKTVDTQSSESAKEVNGVVHKKKGKRKAVVVEIQKEEIPKKCTRKLTQKKLLTNTEDLTINKEESNNKELESTPVKKRQVRASKKTLESKAAAKSSECTETNGDILSENSMETDSDTSDGDESDAKGKTSDKPVVVTIIRRNKTKNKAQRDKTWHQLTGKPVDELEINSQLKKRGRPPLPESLKKPKKEKPTYYQCKFCTFKSISENIIIQHQFIHNVVDDVSQFKCGQCKFRASNEETLAQHKLSHLMLEIIYKCMFCEYSNKRKNSTMYHTLRHVDRDIANMFYCLSINQITEEEQYECFQCDYQNTEEAVMPDHVIDHQVEKIKNPIMTKFSCSECLYKSKFEHLFKRHQETHEEQRKKRKVVKKEIVKDELDEAPTQSEDNQTQDELGEMRTVYSCEECGYLTYNKRSLTNHKGLKHTRHAPPKAVLEARRKRKVPQPDEIYQCNECDYATQKKPHLTRHMIIHRSKENMEFYECTHCIFETKHRRSYKRHMEMRHRVIV